MDTNQQRMSRVLSHYSTLMAHPAHSDVVTLFCPSFTRSVRFLQADQLVTRLQRVEHNVLTSLPNFMRMMMGNLTVNVM